MTAWATKPLGDVCEILDSRRRPITKNDRRAGEYPYYGATGVVDYVDQYIFDEPLVLVGEDGAKWASGESTAFRVLGRCWVNNHAHVLRPDRKQLLDDWLVYCLVHQDLSPFVSGLTVPKLNQGSLREIPLPMPAVSTQQRIVAILDEAFEGIATAKANAEKNLQSARDLFESQLFALLKHNRAAWPQKTLREIAIDFGRGKSRHRPRNDPKLYGGAHPFIQTGDVRNAGHLITEYTQSYSEAGLAQSKLWPKGTLCITIAANIAETGVLGFDACFPDSVIGVVVDESQTSGKYLEYMLHTVKAELKAKGKGSAQDNINLATFENERFPFPDLPTQTSLVGQLDELSDQVQRLECIYLSKLAALEELKKSLLHQAFSGQLTSSKQTSIGQQLALQTTTPEFTANVISIAHARHERLKREKTFGRVKEQKTLHLIESIAGIDLGRQPMRDAAGPNDFQHMLKAEEWAKAHGFFEMVKTGDGYEFRKLSKFDEHMSRARQTLAPYLSRLEPVIDLLVPLGKEEAEVFATVHAAWNNLLIDGVQATDDAIVSAARQDWHPDKLKIQEHKFRIAIETIRQKKLVPTGSAKYVGGQKALFEES